MKKIYNLFVLALLAIGAQAQYAERIMDINPNKADGTIGSSFPQKLFVLNGKVYFSADNPNAETDNGRELWWTNGTETKLLKDIRKSSDGLDFSPSSSPNDLYAMNGELHFSANDGSGVRPIKSNGTEEGTFTTISDGIPVSGPSVLSNIAYYKHTNTAVDPRIVNALWKYDGSTQTAVTNNGAIIESVSSIFAFGDNVLVYMKNVAVNPDGTSVDTYGLELYQYNPSAGEFYLIQDIVAGTGGSGISNFTELGGMVYFEADDKLYVTDGEISTEAGGTGTTEEVTAAKAAGLSGIGNLYAWDNKLFFKAMDASSDIQLWVYDPALGTVNNISQLKDATNAPVPHNPVHFAALGDYLYYAADDADATSGDDLLYRTDGNTIELVESTITKIDDIVGMGGKLYFEGYDSSTGTELYMLDPTSVPTAIGDAASLSSITVYPNPSNGTVNIKGLETADATYCIYSLTGQCVAKGNIVNNQLSYNKAGMYILQIMDGINTLVQKITVK